MPVVEVNILEQKLLVKSEDGEEHVKMVVDYLNSKIEEVKKNSKAVSTLNVALLAAMNITDDYFEAKERVVKLEGRARELSKLIDKRTD
ncbi:MAG TPA: cell division protein ZapA [Thermodesulfobacteriota bacterium]|nr:cell division protein ZapA [Deltaproteobacteria bacterium]HLA51034.1 cell division protein ZapA [Thermodesulfobacteriota bacterium]